MSEDFTSLAGRLLVAVRGMTDPNFARTVVLMIDHTPEGAVGLALNRPTQADLLDHLPGWWSAAVNPRVVFVGGPAGEGGGIGLARGVRRLWRGGRRSCGFGRLIWSPHRERTSALTLPELASP